MPASTAEPTPAVSRRSVVLIDRTYQLREIGWGVGLFLALLAVQGLAFVGVAWGMKAGALDDITGPVAFVAAAFATPVLLAVLYAWTTARRTHRVAGAAYRLAVDMGRVATDPAFRFRLREGDYLGDVAQALNRVMETLEARQAGLSDVEQRLDDLRAAVDALRPKLDPADADRLASAVDAATRSLDIARFAVAERGSDSDAPSSRG